MSGIGIILCHCDGEILRRVDLRRLTERLAEDPTVQTESEGGGFLKRVRILPA